MSEPSVVLTRHPATPCDAVRALTVDVKWTPPGALALTYRVAADLNRLAVPRSGAPSRCERLWEHMCFEAFVALDGSPAYDELNFSPSRQWATYAFGRYRDIAALRDEAFAPDIGVRHTADGLDLAAIVPLHYLSPAHLDTPLRLALAAVIEDTDGRCAYWALHHPPGKPDFHHASAFALRLEPYGARRD